MSSDPPIDNGPFSLEEYNDFMRGLELANLRRENADLRQQLAEAKESVESDAIVVRCEWLEDAGSTIAELRQELAEAKAIIDKLPKTADGVPLYPGMHYYVRTPSPDIPTYAEQCVLLDSHLGPIALSMCYSTREAAEAARQ